MSGTTCLGRGWYSPSSRPSSTKSSSLAMYLSKSCDSVSCCAAIGWLASQRQTNLCSYGVYSYGLYSYGLEWLASQRQTNGFQLRSLGSTKTMPHRETVAGDAYCRSPENIVVAHYSYGLI